MNIFPEKRQLTWGVQSTFPLTSSLLALSEGRASLCYPRSEGRGRLRGRGCAKLSRASWNLLHFGLPSRWRWSLTPLEIFKIVLNCCSPLSKMRDWFLLFFSAYKICTCSASSRQKDTSIDDRFVILQIQISDAFRVMRMINGPENSKEIFFVTQIYLERSDCSSRFLSLACFARSSRCHLCCERHS